MSHSKKIPRDTMRDILWENHGGEVILDTRTGHSRWSVHHLIVFRLDETGLLYEATYSTAATEYQDDRPWDHEDPVEVFQVEAHEFMTIKYLRVE